MSNNFIEIGNPVKVARILDDIIEPSQVLLVRNLHKKQAAEIYMLGVKHFRFAKRTPKVQWRQRVSRFYYGAYNASKAVRYLVDGNYSRDSSDHKKIDHFPNDFPNLETYRARLKELREDRNKCDYDHTTTAGDLFMSQGETEILVEALLKDVKIYFATRDISLRVQL